VLAAGLDGIEQGLPLPMSAQTAAALLTEAERATRGIEALPASLGEAIERFEASTLMR
jgi:glutamine synthetase